METLKKYLSVPNCLSILRIYSNLLHKYHTCSMSYFFLLLFRNFILDLKIKIIIIITTFWRWTYLLRHQKVSKCNNIYGRGSTNSWASWVVTEQERGTNDRSYHIRVQNRTMFVGHTKSWENPLSSGHAISIAQRLRESLCVQTWTCTYNLCVIYM